MKFSNVDVIGKELSIIDSRKNSKESGIFSRIFNYFIYPKNREYTFTFYVPEGMFVRASSFCDDVEEQLDDEFNVADLAGVLYTDFIKYVRSTNDVHDVYRRLRARGITPTKIQPYSTEDVYEGVIFEEVRGFEIVKTRISHEESLRGETLLQDMEYLYPSHGYILENVLEIVFCDFIEDCRKCLIKNPVKKILQYI